MERKTKELEIKGPEADEELVEYFIWLPYKAIKDSDNYRIAYINYLKEGILKVLRKYNFDLALVEVVFSKIVKEEVASN